MIARISAAVRMPVPNGGPWNRTADQRQLADRVDHRRLDVLRHERHDHEEAPHAVDDRRHGGQQLDRGADRPAQPGRRQLGQEEGDAEGQRHRQDQGQHRGHDGAVDRAPPAPKTSVTGSHSVGPEEAGAEGAEGRQPAEEQLDDDRAEQHQHEDAGARHSAGEDGVARMPRRGCVGLARWYATAGLLVARAMLRVTDGGMLPGRPPAVHGDVMIRPACRRPSPRPSRRRGRHPSPPAAAGCIPAARRSRSPFLKAQSKNFITLRAARRRPSGPSAAG